MKKITLLLLITLALPFITVAQDGYTYTLIDNGSYSFSVSAVPNTSASNFTPSVQSYGFTIILPDGVTATITSSLGSGAGATFFNGTDVAQPTIDGYLITETLGSPISLPTPASGTVSPMVTIQVNGSPATGIITLLANNSVLATTVTPLKSFMQADMIDDGMAVFANAVDPVGTGLSAVTNYDFSTLSISTIDRPTFSVYPNPSSDVFNIKSNQQIDSVELFDISGRLVLKTAQTNSIKVKQLPNGMYLMKIYSEAGSFTKKVIIN